MSSIYRFFDYLLQNRQSLASLPRLDLFQWESSIVAVQNIGKFPDLILRSEGEHGGEFIELKSSNSYTIPSFNSTIPTGKKSLRSVVKSSSSAIFQQLRALNEEIHLDIPRDVYYLIRGRKLKTQSIKVCLVHGSFFETIRAEELVRNAFEIILKERLENLSEPLDAELQHTLLTLFTDQDTFSRVRDVAQASVKLRFRVMTEAKKEGNCLNSTIYPQITDNTINLLLPYDRPVSDVPAGFAQHTEQFVLQHALNGPFNVYQARLSELFIRNY